YGFDFRDFNINEGSILPNNTAGISIAYRFSKVKDRAVYPEINWSNGGSLITVQSLKDYQNKKDLKGLLDENRFVEPVKLHINKKTLRLSDDSLKTVKKMQALIPLFVADSVLVYQDSFSKAQDETVFVQNTQPVINRGTFYLKRDSSVTYDPNLYHQRLAENSVSKKSLKQQTASDFKLSDFTDATRDTMFVFNGNSGSQNVEPVVVNNTPTMFTQPYNYSTPQNLGYSNYTSDYEQALVVPKNEDFVTGLQVAETSSNALLNAQLGKLISLQTKTLALLTQSKIKSDSSAVFKIDQSTMDSLKFRIADLENRLKKMERTDSLNNFKPVSDKKNSLGSGGFCVISYPVNETELTDLQRNIIISNVFKSYLKNDQQKISLESFTDNTGSSAYNKKLSDLRLKRAVQFLLALGVAPQDLITSSYGETKASEETNPEERRLEIKVITTEK
ncbi:MAG TPA: OmpA family protein, partial [Pelobium sp.]|nr:OmpA family protein [Pelobium sp.]